MKTSTRQYVRAQTQHVVAVALVTKRVPVNGHAGETPPYSSFPRGEGHRDRPGGGRYVSEN